MSRVVDMHLGQGNQVIIALAGDFDDVAADVVAAAEVVEGHAPGDAA